MASAPSLPASSRCRSATRRRCERAITPHTCAFLFEPIQCEAGILIPPDGYLKAAADICRRERVLLVADEIQTGLGRTGRFLACDHEGVRPDVLILGKALSGGMYPVSAVVSSAEILGVFRPGSHGSTYGGNPLACAVARAALRVMVEERLAERSAELGAWLMEELRRHRSLAHPRDPGPRAAGRHRALGSGAPLLRTSERPGRAVQRDARVRHPPGSAAGHLARRPGLDGYSASRGLR